MRRSRQPVPLLVSVALLLGAVSAWPQAPEGAIVGAVHDLRGGRIPGATISAQATGFHLTRTATANDQGEFRLPALSPGEYQLRAEAAGFDTLTVTVHVA